jgi:hypothetical protein
MRGIIAAGIATEEGSKNWGHMLLVMCPLGISSDHRAPLENDSAPGQVTRQGSESQYRVL